MTAIIKMASGMTIAATTPAPAPPMHGLAGFILVEGLLPYQGALVRLRELPRRCGKSWLEAMR